MRALITSASLALVFFLPSAFAQSINTASYRASVPLSATVTQNGVTLTAPVQVGTSVSYDVYRRLRNATGTSWGTATTISVSLFVYADALPDNRIYEYKVVRHYVHSGQSQIGYGYICAGKESPASEWMQHADHYMGKVVVLMESTVAQALPSSSIQMLMDDLRADGWQPELFTGISSAVTPASVKSLIFGANAGGEVKAILLVGRIPVPLSYNETVDPDGHGEYPPFVVNRLWPADAYYGDLDVAWSGPGQNGAHFNLANFPSQIEIPVGRIDFRDMPGTESSLIAAYIQRAHDFRTGVITPKSLFGIFSIEKITACA